MSDDRLDPYRAEIDAIERAIAEQPGDQSLAIHARELRERQARLAHLQAEARYIRLQADKLEPPKRPGIFRRAAASVGQNAFKWLTAILVIFGIGELTYSLIEAWNADGYVIGSFSVPNGVAAGGLSGDVAARRFLDHLLFIHLHDNKLRSSVLRRANFRHKSRSEFQNTSQETFKIVEPVIPIKIDIPSASFSLGDIYNLLFKRFSHETVISADLYEEKPAAGAAAPLYRLTAHLGNGAAACSSTGTNFENLFSEAAGCVFRTLDLYRYAAFLANQGNYNDAKSIYIKVAREGSDHDRENAFEALDYLAQNFGIARVFDDSSGPNAANNSTRYQNAVRFLRSAVNPRGGPGGSADFPFAYKDLIVAEETLGDDEKALQDTQKLLDLIANPPSSDDTRWSAAGLMDEFSARRASAQGDFTASLNLARSNAALVAEALAATHDKAALKRLAGLDNVHKLQVYERLHRWSDVVSLGEAARSDCEKSNCIVERQVLPILAEASVMLAGGDKAATAAAAALIARVPPDCYFCARMHGAIDVAMRNWGGAQYWFERAAHGAPSLPFADADLGALLMRRGKFAGAIAHFMLANQKGPHFADPLEMWGEILIVQNRSDLADTKFDEAAGYAPNWGRLHLKWGEALLWLGRKDDARSHFRTASTLDLSAADAAELARVSRL